MKRKNSDGKYEFGIHEVYYDVQGKIQGYTLDSMVPVCSTEDDQKKELEIMLQAFESEILLDPESNPEESIFYLK